MISSDLELLRCFARERAQNAFTELVERHLNLVYSAALRQVRSPQLAEEIAQSVFADLARNAGKLQPDTVLVAWLHAVTRRTAVDVIRKESRRQLREQLAIEMNALNAPAAQWNEIEPLLDEAVAALDDTDRAAVLLRYFENKSLRDVGQQLGISDDAAQKRVSRAVERLREFFVKRGVTVGAGGLVIFISANAVQAAPVGLALAISTAATLTGTTLATTATVTATKAIAMTALQKTIVTTTIAVLAGAGIYEARQASEFREQVQTLQQQQVALVGQIQALRHAQDEATNHFVALHDDNERLNRNTAELLKLRAELARLKSDARNSAQFEMEDVQAQWAVWLHAVRTNGLIALSDVPYLVQALTNDAIPIRLEATKALRQIGLEQMFNTNLTAQANSELELAARVATPRLVETLKDPDPFVRANAAITLGFLQQNFQSVVPALIELLSDEQNRVAGSAAKALGRYQSKAIEAIPALLRLTQNADEGIRETAIAAVKQIDSEAAQKAGF